MLDGAAEAPPHDWLLAGEDAGDAREIGSEFDGVPAGCQLCHGIRLVEAEFECQQSAGPQHTRRFRNQTAVNIEAGVTDK
jgi:hypothetical protein